MQNLRSIQDIQKAGNEAVRRLRRQKLSSGRPFMINSKKLPKGQCYLEFPDGHIELVTIASNKRDFHIIRQFTNSESIDIRRQYHLLDNA